MRNIPKTRIVFDEFSVADFEVIDEFEYKKKELKKLFTDEEKDVIFAYVKNDCSYVKAYRNYLREKYGYEYPLKAKRKLDSIIKKLAMYLKTVE